MSKRNYIIERASDVNGGQYVQTNSSYNSGYEDGKKAGKEYCASEIEALREQVEKLTEECVVLRASSRSKLETIANLEWQVEKLTKERNAFQDQCIRLKNERAVENGQLAALAEQNEKLREVLVLYSEATSEGYSGVFRACCASRPEEPHTRYCSCNKALSLPNLATPMLNKIKAEAYREAAELVEAHHTWITNVAAGKLLRAKSDELEQQCAP